MTLFVLMSGILSFAQSHPDVLKQIESSGKYAPMFPFQPTHNAPDNITNVRTWPGVDNRPSGQQGFISTSGSHFVDGDGNQIRFIGTQCGMTGCFPSHEQADKLAKEFNRKTPFTIKREQSVEFGNNSFSVFVHCPTI